MKIHIVLLCPIIEEYAETRKFLSSLKDCYGRYSHAPYETGRVKSRNGIISVAIRETGRGEQNVSKAVTQAEKDFSPQYIFLVGTAGGIQKVKLGDVIIADVAYNYESGREKDSGFVPNPIMEKASPILLQKAKLLFYSEGFKDHHNLPDTVNIKAKPIASGSKVVESIDSGTYNMIRSAYSDVRAIEMEAYGFYHIAQNYPEIQFLNVRSISDTLSNKQEANKNGSKELASRHAATVVFALIEQLEVKPKLLNKKFLLNTGIVLCLLLIVILLNSIIPFVSNEDKAINTTSLSSTPKETPVSPTPKYLDSSASQNTKPIKKKPNKPSAKDNTTNITYQRQEKPDELYISPSSEAKNVDSDTIQQFPKQNKADEIIISDPKVVTTGEDNPLNKPQKKINCYIGVYDESKEEVNGVSVFIDGIEEQVANNYLQISVGSHWLVLLKDNLYYYKERITIQENPISEPDWMIALEDFSKLDRPNNAKQVLRIQ